MSTVYFADTSAKNKKSLLEKVEILCQKAGLKNVIKENDLVAIKVHFGERGNTGFVSPIYVRRVVNQIKEAGGKPFVTDANTLYKGSRGNAVDHIQTALENGFSYATIGAPIIIADGLNGHDFVSVPVKGKHLEEVKISSNAVNADAMVVVSHFKGHEMAGFGGTLKNIGMGLGCPSAKQIMHSAAKPEVNIEKCSACRKCVSWCPTDAITVDRVAKIDQEKCYSCGECTVTCTYGAIMINWHTSLEDMMQRVVEHAAGAVQGKENKTLYLNFLTNITPDCDCWGWSDAALINDIGILASTDPIAIDKASLDLVTEALKNKIPDWKEREAATIEQVRYGQELGMGSMDYELKKLNL